MAVFTLQMSRPLQHETLVMFLDGNRHGSTLVTVSEFGPGFSPSTVPPKVMSPLPDEVRTTTGPATVTLSP